MASGTTYQALKRLAFLPTRDALDNGSTIGGQDYDDVFFFGGEAHNLRLIDCILVPGGGGGGVTSEHTVTSGSSYTASLNELVKFNSNSGLAKTLNIPAPTGTLNIIIFADIFGDGYNNPITPVPAAGLILNPLSAQVYTNGGSVTLLDTLGGWLPI